MEKKVKNLQWACGILIVAVLALGGYVAYGIYEAKKAEEDKA